MPKEYRHKTLSIGWEDRMVWVSFPGPAGLTKVISEPDGNARTCAETIHKLAMENELRVRFQQRRGEESGATVYLAGKEGFLARFMYASIESAELDAECIKSAMGGP